MCPPQSKSVVKWEVIVRFAHVLVILCLSAAVSHAAEPVDADVLLRGGTVYDGIGGEGVVGDVAIRGDRIVAVGTFDTGAVGRVIDCKGMVVCPGFIDLHNHSDRPIIDSRTRGNVNFLTQGCTTVVTGNCGGGHVDVGEYFAQIDVAGAGTNTVHLLPQGSLRSAVMGTENRAPSSEELEKMKELADRAMRDGAYGMSTGLIYVPGTYATTDEIVEIAKVVAAHGGIYASHIRNEAQELLAAVREAIEIGRRAGLAVHISHFKASRPVVWGLVHEAAAVVEEARKEGLRVTADQYPYIASSTSLEAMMIPTSARAGGQKALLARLDDPEAVKGIREYIAEQMQQRGDRAPLRIARYRARPEWMGKSLREIAAAEQRGVDEIVFEITRNGGASAVSFGMSEEDVRYVMQLPWVATASDGSARLPADDKPHPRNYGTFPRKIGRYAIEEKVVSPAQAIRSSTGLPADILSITDRGYLKAGAYADVIVFDQAEFRDVATFDEPHQYSHGLRYVFVNGQPAVHEGVPTGALAGRALRHGDKAGETK